MLQAYEYCTDHLMMGELKDLLIDWLDVKSDVSLTEQEKIRNMTQKHTPF